MYVYTLHMTRLTLVLLPPPPPEILYKLFFMQGSVSATEIEEIKDNRI